MNRIDREKEVITLMINLYCEKKHKTKKGQLCPECEELLEYAHKRLTNCKFQNEKTTCGKCSIHCYKKDMRIKVKEVMRFSGPRILFYRPIEFIRHLLDK